jgi:hypothetical protein
MKNTAYQPKTGQPCHCKRGVQRDNCPDCEGTGQRIDFKAIRDRNLTISPEAAQVRPLAAVLEDGPAQFTPGPWKLGREDYAYFEHGGMTLKVNTVGIDGGNGDQDICRIVTGDPLGEGQANARLIAAAPSLLEALKACSDYFAAIDAFQPKKNRGCVGDQVRIQARAALAAATGQEVGR